MNQNFAATIPGGTGQVGGAAVEELLAIPECREVVMVARKPIAPRSRVGNVILDAGAEDFAERTAALVRAEREFCPPRIFRPGIIAGNAHTPAWVSWLARG